MNEDTDQSGDKKEPLPNPSEMSSWAPYSEGTKDNPPRELLTRAMPHVVHKNRALDLGPGALNDSKYLLDQGFGAVIAVNADPPEKDPVVQSRIPTFPQDRFEYRVSSFDAFDFEPNSYDLINAQYSLPFNPPETFDRMIASMIASLKPGGIVTGQFFGPRDAWNDGSRSMTFVTSEHAQKLLHDLILLEFKENEGLKKQRSGQDKYWHTFDFIARKPLA